MKSPLRPLALVSALTLSAFAIAGPAAAIFGTCRTTCVNDTTQATTQVLWSTSQSQCCSFTPNPCPAGTHPWFSAFQQPGGTFHACPNS
jgi:hypothetical protein